MQLVIVMAWVIHENAKLPTKICLLVAIFVSNYK